MLSFLNPRQQQLVDGDLYNTLPQSSNSNTFLAFIKRSHLLVRKKPISISSTLSTIHSSLSDNSIGTEQKYQHAQRYYKGKSRRRITFSRVVIVNDPATFLIVKEGHNKSNNLGRKPSRQRIDEWLRRSSRRTYLTTVT
ncbi:hypothetical protein INT45_009150 [Circinella minor]|uniref:Uncharacterized protein n=1 Tax=Circinella minor TaxID=1195481 RepID=A0A8H7SD40_9FUNG|nr:hypothetical protein INT45_009150 [Circinella minor]